MLKRILVFWIAWFVVLFTAYYLAVAGDSEASSYDIIELQRAVIDYKSYLPGGSDPLLTQTIPNRTLGQGLNLTVDTDLFEYLYWNSTIHSDTDQVLNPDGSTAAGQFRLVGLEMAVGVDFRRFDIGVPITFGYYHYSQHLLDYSTQNKYPVRDAIEIQLYIYERNRK